MTSAVVLAACTCNPMIEVSSSDGLRRRLPLPANARFSVTYRHSMYRVPFTEEYVVDADGRIRLFDLRSDDGTVLDYYALEGRPGEVPALGRRFPALAFGIALAAPQTLTIAGRRWSFLDFGPAGSEVVLRAARECARNESAVKPPI